MKFKKPKSQAQLQMECDAFNFNYAVGDTVKVMGDHGEIFQDKISHKATIMGGHTSMAWLSGKGSYLLERIISKA